MGRARDNGTFRTTLTITILTMKGDVKSGGKGKGKGKGRMDYVEPPNQQVDKLQKTIANLKEQLTKSQNAQ